MINTSRDTLAHKEVCVKRKKLKQDEIAKHLGIDRTTYLRKEKGQIPLTAEEFLLIADFLELNLLQVSLQNPHLHYSTLMMTGTRLKDENLLIRIYRLLNNDERRRDLLFSLRLILKGVER